MEKLLFHRTAATEEECFKALREGNNTDLFPGYVDGVPWCNGTWDTVLCWPPIPANSSYTVQCPPLKGLDTSKFITKHCHSSGRWAGRTEDDFSGPAGWTDFISCMLIDLRTVDRQMVVVNQTIDVQQIGDAMRNTAKIARILEIVCLALSLCALIAAIFVLTLYKRLRFFGNCVRVQLMLATLISVIIRMIFYIDFIFAERYGPQSWNTTTRTIHTTRILCEVMYVLFEYVRTAACAWIFVESVWLLFIDACKLQFGPTGATLKTLLSLFFGWILPLLPTAIWLLVTTKTRHLKVCFVLYHLRAEYLIMESCRFHALSATAMILLIALCVNCCCSPSRSRITTGATGSAAPASENSSHTTTKKIVQAFLVLLLLAVPLILLTKNVQQAWRDRLAFDIYMYLTTILNSLQGFLVAVVYCFADCKALQAIFNLSRPRSCPVPPTQEPISGPTMVKEKGYPSVDPSAQSEATAPLLNVDKM